MIEVAGVGELERRFHGREVALERALDQESVDQAVATEIREAGRIDVLVDIPAEV